MKKFLVAPCLALLIGFMSFAVPASAQNIDASTPDALVRTLTNDVMNSVKSDSSIQSGDVNRITQLVNTHILPYSDFERTTRQAMGRYWAQATPQQQAQITTQFKMMLIRTYAGAIAQIRNQQVQFRPYRGAPTDQEATVQTVVQNQGQPIELDYRLEKTAGGWKVYDLNVGGFWLVQAYRQQFSEQIAQNGVAGLLTFLTQRNEQLSASGK
ncbi:MAG: MlaC/ttg2D family ABC transporter substrate-binding protein [Janthinobacterium lividum]